MQRLQRIAYLDGIRAVAIGAVVLDHWGFLWGSPFRGGYIGVDLFFVLSGYIITKLIRRSDRRFSYRSFLAARVRRLYPALIGVVLVVAPLSAVLTPQSVGEALRAGAFALLQANSLLVPLGAQVNPFGPTWSLSAEWCSYLVLPWLLLLVGRLPRRGAVAALLVVALGLYGASAPLLSSTAFYYGPIARAAEIAVGAALAIAVEGGIRFLDSKRWSFLLGSAGIAFVVVWSILGVDEASATYRWVGLPLAVVAAVALILCGLPEAGSAMSRGLASAPFSGLGRVSYSLYLWHAVPLEVNWTWSSGLGLPLYLLVSVAFVIVTTGLSARYLERSGAWRSILRLRRPAIVPTLPDRLVRS